jgi:hypothetical protein
MSENLLIRVFTSYFNLETRDKAQEIIDSCDYIDTVDLYYNLLELTKDSETALRILHKQFIKHEFWRMMEDNSEYLKSLIYLHLSNTYDIMEVSPTTPEEVIRWYYMCIVKEEVDKGLRPEFLDSDFDINEEEDEIKNQEVIIEENIPEHIKEILRTLKSEWDCCVCLEKISDLEITNCGHFMCKNCFKILKETAQGNNWNCPVCRKSSKK